MNELKVCSYNIWFDNIMIKERLESLLAKIILENPDVVCLQEVRPEIYDIIKNSLQNEYKYTFPKTINTNYSCVTLSKLPISKYLIYPFKNSKMDRSLIITKIDYPFINNNQNDQDNQDNQDNQNNQDNQENTTSIDKIEIVIVNTHFESIFSRKSKNIVKIDQYKETHKIMEQLVDDYKNVILCADTNILNKEESEFIPTNKFNRKEKTYEIISDISSNAWNDSWKLLGNNNNKFTYDSNINPYLMIKKYKYRSRLDRIIFKSNNLILIDFRLLQEIKGFVEPSDHYGIIGKFEIKSDE